MEQSLVQRDPQLLGLATLLDEARFLQLLQGVAPDVPLLSARRDYIRYKPHTNALVRYHIHSQKGRFEVVAKAFGDDASAKLAKALERQGRASVLSAARFVFPELQIELCVFPNDDKLKRLYLLATPEDTATEEAFEKWQKILRALFHKDTRCSELISIRHKPERRYVAKAILADGSVHSVKMYTRRQFELVQSKAQFMQQHAATSSPLSLPLSPPLTAVNPRYQLLAHQWLQGERLADAVRAGTVTDTQMRAVAEALSRLHQLPVSDILPRRDHVAMHQQITALAEGLVFLLPELASRGQALAQRLSARLAEIDTPLCVIHGDFYSDQVVHTPQGAMILDIDDLCVGYPAYDLGLFLAHLYRDTDSALQAHSRVTALRQTFLTAYSSHTTPASTRAIDLFVSLALFSLIHHPFRHCEPECVARMTHLLEQAERALERYAAMNDETMPQISRALDLARMTPLLRSALGAEISDKTLLVHADVHRHRAGKRCVLTYALDNADTQVHQHQTPRRLFAKIRARGLDRRTYLVNKALHDQGFTAGCADQVEVPTPLGCLPELSMWVQQGVEGEAVFPLLCGRDAAHVGARIADPLYKLHASGVPSTRMHGIEEELQILEKQFGGVTRAKPELRERLERIYAACCTLAHQLPPAVSCGIHRDFYHDQLILDGETVYVLDLDLYAIGDPALDLGNFIAHLQEQSLRERGTIHATDVAVEAFVERYLALSPDVSRQAIAAYTTLSFVRHIAISQRIQTRNAFTVQIITLSEQKLSVQRGGTCGVI